MLRKSLLTSALGVFLTIWAANAQVYVQIGPPRPQVERRTPPPGSGYVWTPGYQRWDGHRHEWVQGAWVRPPHRRAHWVPARWEHRRGGWVFIEGHWR
jgi:hypothetical protein